MNATQFLALFPMVERNVCTGGNCYAWYARLPDGCEVLITLPEGGGYQPSLNSQRVDIGLIGPEGGEELDFCWHADWTTASLLMARWVALANNAVRP